LNVVIEWGVPGDGGDDNCGDGAAGNSRIRKDARIELLGGFCLCFKTTSAGPACGGKVLNHIGT